MTQDRSTPNSNNPEISTQKSFESTYYGLLGLHPAASVRDIRQAYRDLSKLYHPDTTELTAAVATEKFQQLNEAYATLSSPERRTVYDQKIGYSRLTVVRSLPGLNRPQPKVGQTSSAYLDATDRPLSAGELFALFILGVTFVGCLVLAVAIGLTKGEVALLPFVSPSTQLETQMVAPSPVESPLAVEPRQSTTLTVPTTKTPKLDESPAVPLPLSASILADQTPAVSKAIDPERTEAVDLVVPEPMPPFLRSTETENVAKSHFSATPDDIVESNTK